MKTVNRLSGTAGSHQSALGLAQVRVTWRRLAVLAAVAVLLNGVGCTTTTRSVNESPRDPNVSQPASEQQPRGRRQASEANSRQSTQPVQFEQLEQADVERLIVRGQTRSYQILNWFGQPHSVTQSGDSIFWNYTHRVQDTRRNMAGLKSLNVVFNNANLVVDFEFQSNLYPTD